MPILRRSAVKGDSSPALKQNIKIGFWPNWSDNPTFAFILVIMSMFLFAWMLVGIRNDLRQYFYIGKAAQDINSITISGDGKVVEVPDIAQINLGLDTEKKTVEEAQAENTKTMNSFMAKLKSMGVDEKDIKTDSYNVYPVYDYTDARGRQLKGYSVSQSLGVKIRDLEKVSPIVALAGQEGLNQVGSLNFTIDDPESIKVRARELALQNAKEKAQALADVLGVRLGRIMSFSESSSEPGYPAYTKMYAMEGIGGASEAPDLAAGSQEIQVTATIEYEIMN